MKAKELFKRANMSTKAGVVSRRAGFTIVELLVVIVVIAILAAITVVSYNGLTKQAIETTMKSDLKSAASTLEIDNVRNGAYPANAGLVSNGQGLKSSGSNVFNYSVDDTGYCISVTNARVDSVFYLRANGQITAGACPILIATITTSTDHTCALGSGRAYCWGVNNDRQLGDGTTTTRTSAVAVDTTGVLAGKTISTLSAGGSHTCALVGTTEIYCWGRNGNGELGDGTTTTRTAPVATTTSGVLAGRTITAMVTGSGHTCVIASSQLYCWGYNGSGQLGDGTTTNRTTPVAVNTAGVLAGKTITAVTTGSNHTCAIASDQRAYCWGNIGYGQIGDGTSSSNRLLPVAVSTSGVLSGKDITAISAGGARTCAIATGQAYCWGDGGSGALGDGATSNRTSPVAVNAAGVLSGLTITAISPGNSHTCALASNQLAYCWGSVGYGQVGDGTSSSNRLTPVAVSTSGVLAGKAITSIDAGGYHTCAVSSNQGYCWGNNFDGNLNDGTTTNRLSPVEIRPL